MTTHFLCHPRLDYLAHMQLYTICANMSSVSSNCRSIPPRFSFAGNNKTEKVMSCMILNVSTAPPSAPAAPCFSENGTYMQLPRLPSQFMSTIHFMHGKCLCHTRNPRHSSICMDQKHNCYGFESMNNKENVCIHQIMP